MVNQRSVHAVLSSGDHSPPMSATSSSQGQGQDHHRRTHHIVPQRGPASRIPARRASAQPYQPLPITPVTRRKRRSPSPTAATATQRHGTQPDKDERPKLTITTQGLHPPTAAVAIAPTRVYTGAVCRRVVNPSAPELPFPELNPANNASSADIPAQATHGKVVYDFARACTSPSYPVSSTAPFGIRDAPAQRPRPRPLGDNPHGTTSSAQPVLSTTRPLTIPEHKVPKEIQDLLDVLDPAYKMLEKACIDLRDTVVPREASSQILQIALTAARASDWIEEMEATRFRRPDISWRAVLLKTAVLDAESSFSMLTQLYSLAAKSKEDVAWLASAERFRYSLHLSVATLRQQLQSMPSHTAEEKDKKYDRQKQLHKANKDLADLEAEMKERKRSRVVYEMPNVVHADKDIGDTLKENIQDAYQQLETFFDHLPTREEFERAEKKERVAAAERGPDVEELTTRLHEVLL